MGIWKTKITCYGIAILLLSRTFILQYPHLRRYKVGQYII
jgi:hypothetical protein